MTEPADGTVTPEPRRRSDAVRNAETLVEVASAAFLESGVNVPVRDIAARAGVGVGTIYRHFPTRADLIVAVYRHQVDACADAGPSLVAGSLSPYAALSTWIHLFVDFLATKRGLAQALQSDDAAFETMHDYFLGKLVPVCADMLAACTAAGETRSDVTAVGLLRAVGNLCIGAGDDSRYDARRMVDVLIAGLHVVDGEVRTAIGDRR